MPKEIFPSSFEFDCGHQSDFFENTIRDMKAMSQKKKVYLADAAPEEHTIVFYRGKTVEVPHLVRVATRQHLGHQVIIIGRLVARMGACKPVPVLSKDLLEDVPVPRGLCQHRVAPSWGVRIFAVK